MRSSKKHQVLLTQVTGICISVLELEAIAFGGQLSLSRCTFSIRELVIMIG